MGTTERVKLYLEKKGISKYVFYKKTGFSNKFLDNSSNMGTNKAEIILHHYPDINPEWLLTGNGSMLKALDKKSINQSIVGNNNQLAGGDISTLENEINTLKKQLAEKDVIIGNLIKQQEKLITKLTNI